VHAPTRAQALARTRAALHETVLLGCGTNIAFLGRLLMHPLVQNGEVHTSLIQEHLPSLQRPPPSPATLYAVVAAAALSSASVEQAADAVPPLHAAIGAWRN
jgi:acetyl-CoA/propionyl-CoA carboxylase biotin carboxyl carrier protein